MITRKHLHKILDKYIREVITGPLGPSDLKYKGIFRWVNEFPMQQYEPMTDLPKPISMQCPVGRVEIATRLLAASWLYETTVIFTCKGQKHVASFEIPKEAWGRQALEFGFREYCFDVEKHGLIELTPEEEYAEVKKKAIAKACGVDTNSHAYYAMLKLKAEIEELKNLTVNPPKWLVTDPHGNKSVVNIDASQQIMYNIQKQIALMNAADAGVHNNLKKLTEEYYKEHGEFPGPEALKGMQVTVGFDPGSPNGMVFHTASPPMKQLSKSHKPQPTQYYGEAGNELSKLIPALSFRGANCPAPHHANDARCHMYGQPLSEIIIHLNDSHRWPRSGTDPNPNNLPNIADWIDEVCIKHGLDQTFHPKQEKKPTIRDWSNKKKKQNKIQGASASFHIEDEPFKGMYDGA